MKATFILVDSEKFGFDVLLSGESNLARTEENEGLTPWIFNFLSADKGLMGQLHWKER